MALLEDKVQKCLLKNLFSSALSLTLLMSLSISCSQEPELELSTEPSILCPMTSDHAGNDTTRNVGSGEKIANEFYVYGTTSVTLPLSSISFYIGSTNLTSITVDIHDGASGIGVVPDTGTLLGTTTINLDGSTTTDINEPLAFSFSTDVPLEVGRAYIIISATGGSFDIGVNTEEADGLSNSEIWTHNGSSWTSGTSSTENLASNWSFAPCIVD